MLMFGLGFSKLSLKFSSSNIKGVTDLLALTAGATKNGGNCKNHSKFTARMPTFGLGFPKLSLKFV